MDGKKMNKDFFSDEGWDNHENSFEETIRREMLSLKKENELLKEDFKQLTESYYKLLKRKECECE